MPGRSEPNANEAERTPRGRLPLELEQELRRAVEEIERGEFVDLSPEELDRWVDTGAAPWPDGFPD